MLVLTRNLGQTICINDDIRIRVLSISGDLVKLGITAPRNTTIHREELYIVVTSNHERKNNFVEQ